MRSRLLEKGQQDHALLRAFTYAGKRSGTVVDLWVQKCPDVPEVSSIILPIVAHFRSITLLRWAGRGGVMAVCGVLAGGLVVVVVVVCWPAPGQGLSACLITHCSAGTQRQASVLPKSLAAHLGET